MQVRQATGDDIGEIVALLADDQLGRVREDPGDLTPYRETFEAIRRDPNQLLVVLSGDARPPGPAAPRRVVQAPGHSSTSSP